MMKKKRYLFWYHRNQASPEPLSWTRWAIRASSVLPPMA